MKAKSILPLVIVISALLAQVTFGALPRYEITDLGTLGGTYSRAFAINDAGQVVGVSQTIESGGHAFLWDRRNGMIDLGVLYEGDMSAAYGVNDHGQVVGFSGPDDRDAFIWDSENGMRCPEGFGSEARAINNAGQVVVNTEFHSYLWHPNEVAIVVGSLGTDRVSACALNSAGQVVGHAYTSINEYHAFLWDRATGMRDLGTLGGTRSMAFGINDTGQVVGKSRTTTGDWHEHAFLWNSDTGMIDLGEGRALAINNAEQVVGYMSSSGPAFYWDSDIGMIQLSDLLLPNSGWRELHYASDINKRGQVVGTGLTDNGKIHGFLMTPVPPRTYYVDDDANGANDGSSWADAYNYLQDALAAAWSGDEIRVAQGIYTPDSNSANPNGSGDRTATFQLINGVTLKGGYAGAGTSDPNARDIETYKTILTGDLDGNDVDINEPYDLFDEPTRAENSYHIVTSSNTDANAVLGGFTIAGGNANNGDWHSPYQFGGGMYNYQASPTVLGCTFTRNSAASGGAMYNMSSNSTLRNCSFIGNSAHGVLYYGAYGGGIYESSDSFSDIRQCVFVGNSAQPGGGIFSHGQSVVTDCFFKENSGGGMWCENAELKDCTFTSNLGRGIFISLDSRLDNCLFTGNIGGLQAEDCDIVLTNCSFIGNITNGLFAGIWNDEGDTKITNCISWGNIGKDGVTESAQIATEDPAVINYCCIQGWTGALGGTGNIGADPCFVSEGYWDPLPDYNDDYWERHIHWVDGDYHLLPDSLCIDTGDPNYVPEPNETDLDGNPRVIGGRIDMGAYESPIFAEARILPRTINLASKGKSITCYIRLPEGYDVADIDPNSVFFEEQIKAEPFSVNEQQQVATAKFIREDVQPILEVGDINLTITGQLTDGTVFEATDTVKVTDRAGGKSAK